MANDRYSKGEAIKFGWEAMKDNFVFFLVFLIVAWVISAAISLGGNPYSGPDNTFFAFFFNILSFIFSMFISIAVIKIGLRLSAAPGAAAEVSDAWSGYPYFLNILVGAILYGLIVLGGLILLIVPGIIWGIKYQYFGFLIIDRNMGPVEALKRSGEITKGYKGDLFLLGLLFFGISLLGFLVCCVGIFAAIPTIMVAHAFVYRRLEQGAASAQLPQVPEAAPAPEA